MPYQTKVNLDIYGIDGEKIKTLISDELEQGEVSLNWNGINNQGDLVSSGIYFIVLKTDNNRIVRKVTMLK